ncbi:Amidase related to nicotinamidase [Gilliamella apicola SCGC AB-598-I20]|nr:Amidase related to nicotinamidase [Gilliamella apicola SCGC AB-598-I20]
MVQALMIIDVQNDYFPNGKYPLNNTEQTLQYTLKLQNYFRQKQLPIIYIQHVNQDANAPFFVKNSVGCQLHFKLLPVKQNNEFIIEKAYPNSFYQTQLLQKLQQEGITQLVICGMMSHMCVDSTTRSACELNYQPILIHDACSTRDLDFNGNIIPSQLVHNSFMSALMRFATVMSCESFIKTI